MQTEFKEDNLESAQRAFDDAKAAPSSNVNELAREYLVVLEQGLKWVYDTYPGMKPSHTFGPSWSKEEVVRVREEAEGWASKIQAEQIRVRNFLNQISNDS